MNWNLLKPKSCLSALSLAPMYVSNLSLFKLKDYAAVHINLTLLTYRQYQVLHFWRCYG